MNFSVNIFSGFKLTRRVHSTAFSIFNCSNSSSSFCVVIDFIFRPSFSSSSKGVCHACKKGKLITITTFTARGPPKHWLDALNHQENKCQ